MYGIREILTSAVETAGSQEALAAQIGEAAGRICYQQYISRWSVEERIPLEWVLAVHWVTGAHLADLFPRQKKRIA